MERLDSLGWLLQLPLRSRKHTQPSIDDKLIINIEKAADRRYALLVGFESWLLAFADSIDDPDAVVRHETQEAVVPAGLFLLGYLVAWTWYSALATLGQWSLWIAAFSPSIEFDPSLFGGGLLLATGIFQFTPLKYACLARCQSPLGFFQGVAKGSWGAFMMGLRSGNFCVICCWALMGLMFIAGAMSLFWMAIITAFVLVEKVVPGGKWVSYISGLFLIVWGIWMLVFGY